MLRLKSLCIAVSMLCSVFLIFYVNSSEAASITSLGASAGDDWGEGGTISGHLGTDEDVDYINWYVNDAHEYTSMLGNGTTWVNADLGAFTGSISGEMYTVRAVAHFWDEDSGEWLSDEDTYDVKVYRPESDASTQLDVSGSVYLHSIDYSVGYISPSVSAYAYNNGNEWDYRRYIFHRFRHLVTGPNINRNEEDETLDGSQELEAGASGYSAYTPSNFSIYIGDGIAGKEYTSTVYVRLEVSGDVKENNPNGGAKNVFHDEDWNVVASATFTLD